MTLRGWSREVSGRWRWIAGGLLLGLLIGGGLANLSPRQYAAETTLYVTSGIPSADNQAAYQAVLLSQQRMKSYVALITSDRVAQDVVDTLGLREPAATVAKHVSAVAQENTWVLTITASDATPAGAAQLANTTATSFGRLAAQLEQSPGEAPGQTPVRVQVVQRASPPSAPDAPSLAVYLVLGGIIGLLSGVAAAALRRLLDDTVRSVAGLADVLGAPALGAIPRVRRDAGASEDPAQVEAYRRVRATMRHGNRRDGTGVLVITSAGAGEGRTAVASNLAVALATGGSRVLVVDADLRRPTARNASGIPCREGLTDVLAGRSSITRAVERSPRSVDVLCSGDGSATTTSEILASQQMSDLLAELRQEYDVVLLDSPPLLDSADGLELAAAADGTILVVQVGRSTYGQVAAAVAALRGVRASVLGGIVTAVPARELREAPPTGRSVPAPRPPSDDELVLRDTAHPAPDDRSAGRGAELVGSPRWERLHVPAALATEPAPGVSANHGGPKHGGPNHGPVTPERRDY